MAALVSEMPRRAPEVRDAAAQGVRGLVAAVRRALPKDAPADTAPAIASQLVGALQLARALGDNAEGQALLKASRRALLAQYDRQPSDWNESARRVALSLHCIMTRIIFVRSTAHPTDRD